MIVKLFNLLETIPVNWMGWVWLEYWLEMVNKQVNCTFMNSLLASMLLKGASSFASLKFGAGVIIRYWIKSATT